MGLAFRIHGNFFSIVLFSIWRERKKKKKIYGYLACVCMCAESDKRYHGKLGSWIGKSGNVKEKKEVWAARSSNSLKFSFSRLIGI